MALGTGKKYKHFQTFSLKVLIYLAEFEVFGLDKNVHIRKPSRCSVRGAYGQRIKILIMYQRLFLSLVGNWYREVYILKIQGISFTIESSLNEYGYVVVPASYYYHNHHYHWR